MPDADTPEIVGYRSRDPSTVTRATGSNPEELLASVRSAVGSGLVVLIAPDELADTRDDWIALTAAAVIEGATAIETRNPRDARRLLDFHHAIVTGGAELEP